MYSIDLRTPSGLYLGRIPAYNVDLERLERVAVRTIKGLFFENFKRRLSDGYTATAFAANIGKLQEEQPEVIQRLCSGQRHSVGKPQVFQYWFSSSSENQDVTAWLLSFFERSVFIGFTLPTERLKLTVGSVDELNDRTL